MTTSSESASAIAPSALSAGLSEAARDMCAGWFFFGAKAIVKSSPPHATLTANKAALEELVAAGLVTGPHPYNDYGVVEYHGTSAAADVGREAARARFKAEGLL